MPDKRKRLIQERLLTVSLMVGVWTGRGARSRDGSMEGGGAGGHARAQLARLKTPQQFLISATQPLLLVALLLHVHLQVGILLRELPEKKEGQSKHKSHVPVLHSFQRLKSEMSSCKVVALISVCFSDPAWKKQLDTHQVFLYPLLHLPTIVRSMCIDSITLNP